MSERAHKTCRDRAARATSCKSQLLGPILGGGYLERGKYHWLEIQEEKEVEDSSSR